MIAEVVIVLDEGADLPFEISGQIVVVEQDAVLQSLVPALDLSLGLGMIVCPGHMLGAFVLELQQATLAILLRSIFRLSFKMIDASANERFRYGRLRQHQIFWLAPRHLE
jgi:hypothetical protein